MPKTSEPFFVSVQIAPWEGRDGRRTYSLVALSKQGKIYKYSLVDDQFYEIGTGQLRHEVQE